MKEFLIIGAGFAGISMAWELEKRKISYMVADPVTLKTSTAISGGLVNPVSGRRYNLQWNFDQLSDSLEKNYAALEQQLGVRLLLKHRILKIHKSEAALEDWQKKNTGDDIHRYINLDFHAGDLAKFIDFRYGFLLIKNGYHIDTKLLITSFSEFLGRQEKLIRQSIDIAAIQIKPEYFEYNGEQFRHLIFCEGIEALNNPYFKAVQFKPAKGECFLVDVPNFETSLIIHKGIILIPFEKNTYWAGATNTWNDLSTNPTESGRDELEKLLQDLLRVPYTIHAHQAAIRPTIKDRIPVVGEHPQNKRMYILNGLGTKGASRSWYYAEALADHILNGKELPSEANVLRFF